MGFYSLSFLVVEISILIMILSSSSIGVNLVFEANSLSIIRFIQYLVSEASLRAMVCFDKKSFLDCPKGYRYAYANSASAQFAPIDVPALRNCFDKIFPASSKCFLLSSI